MSLYSHLVGNATQRWYHTIDLPDGTSTPGIFDTRGCPQHVSWPEELRGGRCLDVGTFDGFWSFEMERRGAGEVVAVDVETPEQLDWSYDNRQAGPAGVRARWAEGRGFPEAAALLGSKAKRVAKSVYDLDPSEDGQFDVVFCGALLLHLRDPVRALESMRSVCRGRLLLVEALDAQLEVLAPRVPAARVRPWFDQWFRSNSAGLRELVHVAGFTVESMGKRFIMPLGPGAPASARQSRLSGILARQPGRRGVLLRSLLARPRPPADAASSP
jgi:tRNA (mo5U34)-methyltransferase